MTAATPGPVDSTDAIRLALRSWPEVESYLQGCKGVIIPLGSTEQHGPTGAIGTDALTAEAVALEVGRRTGVLVTPAQACLLYTSPSPRDKRQSRMPSSA